MREGATKGPRQGTSSTVGSHRRALVGEGWGWMGILEHPVARPVAVSSAPATLVSLLCPKCPKLVPASEPPPPGKPCPKEPRDLPSPLQVLPPVSLHSETILDHMSCKGTPCPQSFLSPDSGAFVPVALGYYTADVC